MKKRNCSNLQRSQSPQPNLYIQEQTICIIAWKRLRINVLMSIPTIIYPAYAINNT